MPVASGEGKAWHGAGGPASYAAGVRVCAGPLSDANIVRRDLEFLTCKRIRISLSCERSIAENAPAHLVSGAAVSKIQAFEDPLERAEHFWKVG